jgi:hypothetical protein
MRSALNEIKATTTSTSSVTFIGEATRTSKVIDAGQFGKCDNLEVRGEPPSNSLQQAQTELLLMKGLSLAMN